MALRSLFHPKLVCTWKGGETSRKYYTTCYVSRVMFAICCNVQMFVCIVIVVNEIKYHCFIPSRRNHKVNKIQQRCFIPNSREIKKRMKFNTIVSSQIGVKLKIEPNSVALQLGYHYTRFGRFEVYIIWFNKKYLHNCAFTLGVRDSMCWVPWHHASHLGLALTCHEHFILTFTYH